MNHSSTILLELIYIIKTIMCYTKINIYMGHTTNNRLIQKGKTNNIVPL